MEACSKKSNTLAKNTLFLYLRMLFSMIISLYTSRVILQNIGVTDYGIYNAVGGVVSMFSIVSGSLSTSISRNLTFELGRGDTERLNKIFSMSINIQIMLVFIIYLLGESIGLWFLNNKMIIPENRVDAANWIYQFSLITFALNLVSVPYNAVLIAHEKMSTYAYIGIIETILKLAVVFLLVLSPFDRLITYGFFLLCISFFIRIIYKMYCKRKFPECSYHLIMDREIFSYMFGFATWNFIGASSSVLRSQGVNILLNLFFGPVVNAARGIAMQVNTAVNSFVTSFMTALSPQIMKSYAQGNYTYLLQCIYRGSKFSYFLLYFLSLPVLIETEYVLDIWLKSVPDSTIAFVRFILLFSLVDTYSRCLINANNATGDIKVYQIVIGGLNLTVLPIAYFALNHGAPAESTVIISIVVSLVGLIPRIYFNKKHFPVTYCDFFSKVIFPTIVVSIVGSAIPYMVFKILPQSFSSFVFVCVLCFVSSAISIILLGCSNEEREYALTVIKNKLKK